MQSSDKEINGKPLILIENTREIIDFGWILDCLAPLERVSDRSSPSKSLVMMYLACKKIIVDQN